MSIFKRTQRKYVKKAYRVRNWREYEAGLRNRGRPVPKLGPFEIGHKSAA